MSIAALAPPLTPFSEIPHSLKENGFAVVDAAGVSRIAQVSVLDLQDLRGCWDDMPRDPYLKDGGRYRFRRHASYEAQEGKLMMVPHRAHWQSVEYNALHGGIERWFEPINTALAGNTAWQSLLLGVASLLSGLKPVRTWFIEAHQFRIDTTDGIGRPTPEGAHRDGVDFVAVFLVDRHSIKGGETRIFEAGGSSGLRFTLTQPWS